MNLNLKTTLITLSSVAALLIVISFYVVFYGSQGTYVVSSTLGPNAGIFATSTVADANGKSNTTTSSTSTDESSSTDITASSSTSTVQNNEASVSWTQGSEAMSVTDASLSGSQLTLGVQVTMGSASECVPLNLRMIADEQGNLSPPITSQLTFPDTGSCSGTAGETYSAQPVVFTLTDPATFPVLFTTGGTANTLFEVDQNADGSLSVQLPPNAG